MQRFIANYIPDTSIIARLVFVLLHQELPYRLALDRTNWKYGAKNINILVLSVVYRGVSFLIRRHERKAYGLFKFGLKN